MIRVCAIIILAASISPALADPLYCSTWQGIRTCSSPDGYTSTEMQWQGRTSGQDSDGNHWTTSWWLGIDITTVEQPPER
jgi:hypothetical protein